MKTRLVAFIAAACMSVGPLYQLISTGTVVPQPAAAASIDHPNGKEDRVLAAFTNLPLGFEVNRGQTDPRVRFLARGSGYDDNFGGIAVDGRGNVYITGETRSAGDMEGLGIFPTTLNAFQKTYGNGADNAGGAHNGDAYVAILDAEGKKLVFSSYLGGSGGDFANALALDPFGGVNVAGRTNSTDFPVVDPLQQQNMGGTFDAFVAQVTGLDLDHDYDHDHDNDYGHDHYDDGNGKW